MNRIYMNHAWGYKLPEPFDKADTTSYKHISIYNDGSTKSTLYAPALRAILNYAKLQLACEKGTDCDGAIGLQGEDMVVAEYVSKDRSCVIYNVKHNKFVAGIVDNTLGTITPFCLAEKGQSGSALFFALMPIFLEDSEFNKTYNAFYEQLRNNFSDLDETYRTGYIMCDNIYRRINNPYSLPVVGISPEIPSTGNITPLTEMAINNGIYAPNTTLYGEFKVLKPDLSKRKEYKPIEKEDFVGKYKLSERDLSEAEKELVPELPEWYVITKEVDDICKHIKGTANMNMPVKNIMLRGPAGTGKTESAKAIAAGLNLPYMFLTCSANTEVFDLIGQILPEMNDNNRVDKLPNFDDIMMDPGTVYSELTGTYKEDATQQEVYELLMEKAKKHEEKKQGFKYVDTPLVKAIKNGYVLELQEPAIISNPGVLVGLNGLLDKCESITLPTGETIKRHPESIIVVTTNTDYEGCKSLNQSVISRMNMVMDIDELSKEKLIERVKNVTGFDNNVLLEQMADVMEDISKKCKESMITDGSHGVREFIAWVESTMITDNAYESAMHTVIPLATADVDSREELISTCLVTRIQP